MTNRRQFLTHAHRLGAEQVMFSTFQPASFRLWGRNRKLMTRDPLDENDASMIVNHLYGADGMARLQGGGELRAGDRIVTITAQPGLRADAGVWRGARHCPK